ncbi:phosphatase PAP2 family protein [Hamadaea tsunoensis]|uniref:phosphatase PAP2 family protein n=1 Tax=Hamadaea tsunoensis TaxID=53368 RepID=UPI00040B8543|nr:phosphatase PAP2 family protein [Hamadaea tsunoensis]
MPTPATRRARTFAGAGAAGLIVTLGAGVGFALVLSLVRGQWPPLERLDHDVAASMNRVVAAHHWMQVVLRTITAFGSTLVLSCVIGVVAIALLARRRARLAAYLVVTGVGAMIIGPALKLFVGRLRPVVEQTVLVAPGNSFPSGHSLGSFTCYGALLLIFLPVLSDRGRRYAYAGVAVLVFLIGFSRVALGVHFVSDVLGGWLLALLWLSVTAAAFSAWRRSAGLRPAEPLTEGLEPEAAPAIRPAVHAGLGIGWRTAAGLAVGWVLAFGVVLTLGQLVDRPGNLLGDQSIPHWFAQHRGTTLTQLSAVAAGIGSTPVILSVGLAAALLALAVTRGWRAVFFLAVVLAGEITIFLATVTIVHRARPDVERLDGHLPTSSYPSGHLAATLCLYAAIALIVFARYGRRWGWVAAGVGVLMALAVAWGRLYRGMHHPTDLLGSILLAVCWVGACWLLIPPRPARKPPEVESESR